MNPAANMLSASLPQPELAHAVLPRSPPGPRRSCCDLAVLGGGERRGPPPAVSGSCPRGGHAPGGGSDEDDGPAVEADPQGRHGRSPSNDLVGPPAGET